MVRSDTRPMLLAASLNPADLRRDFGQAPGLAGSGSGFRKSLPHSSHKGHGAGLMAPPWHNTLCLLGMEGLGAQTDGGTVEDVQFWQEILPWPWCCGARQGNALSQGATWAALSIGLGIVVSMGSTWGHLCTKHPALCPGFLEQ